MSKGGYSRKGLFGTVKHYDSKGHLVGESRPGMFGSTKHYDASGKQVGSSRPGMFGSTNIMIPRETGWAQAEKDLPVLPTTMMLPARRSAIPTTGSLVSSAIIRRSNLSICRLPQRLRTYESTRNISKYAIQYA